jgi:hypothetical protein
MSNKQNTMHWGFNIKCNIEIIDDNVYKYMYISIHLKSLSERSSELVSIWNEIVKNKHIDL